MAKNKSSFEGQELAPMEPWRPEYAPQAVSSGRSSASTIVAFVLAAGFGLSIGGAFASQAGILPPLGGTEAAVVADPTAVVDVTPVPTDMPVVDPVPGTDPIVIPPPAGGVDDDEDDDEDEDEDEDEDGDDD